MLNTPGAAIWKESRGGKGEQGHPYLLFLSYLPMESIKLYLESYNTQSLSSLI